MRSRTGIDKGPLHKLTRAPVVAGLALVASALAYVLWKQRRRLTHAERRDPLQASDPRLDAAAALYRGLESALQLQGVTRMPATPPLRHAEDLRARRHPLGEEVFSLTQVYLEARFGGRSLTDPTRRDFERRVRSIRLQRPAVP